MNESLINSALKKACNEIQLSDKTKQLDVALQILKLVEENITDKTDENLSKKVASLAKDLIYKAVGENNEN